MMNTITATFDTDLIADYVDEFSARLDAQGFPPLEVDLENDRVIVDASYDFDSYSVMMAITTVFEELELDTEFDIVAVTGDHVFSK